MCTTVSYACHLDIGARIYILLRFLFSHGKIQSVRIHEHEGNNGAVVAFVDTKSATRAVESTIRLRKVNLSLQYCESSGIPGTNSSDQLTTPLDYTQTSNTR